jgi:hypothetical protein
MAMLLGCAANPRIQYAPVAPDKDGYLKFTLPRSQLLIQPDNTADKNPTVVSVLTENFDRAPAYSLMFRAVSGGLVSTSVTEATYVQNTRILSSLKMAATDNTAQVIKIAGEAAALAGVAALTSAPADENRVVPEVIDPFDKAGRLIEQIDQPLNINTGWMYSLSFLPPSKDLIGYEADFLPAALAGRAGRVLPYPGCIDAILSLTRKASSVAAGRSFVYHVKIADPSRIQTIALPRGKISMHAQCGYDVSNDAGAGNLNTDAMSRLMDIASSLKAGMATK